MAEEVQNKEVVDIDPRETVATLGFKESCFGLREDLELTKPNVKGLMVHPVFDEGEPVGSDRLSEMKANIMLAYRHLEDARMRLGKAIQAYDGGKSVYPR